MNSQFDEIKINCKEDCGNAPKKELLKDFTIALAKKNIDFCSQWVRDEITWEIVGDKLIEGKVEYEKMLQQFMQHSFQELTIHNIITHGNTASVNGKFVTKNNKILEFCDVYHFAGFGKKAKIKKITSYVISIHGESTGK